MTGDGLERLRRLVADVLGVPVDGLGVETSHADVPGWDSLGIVKLAMAIEAEFQTTVSPDDAANFTSIRAILDLLHQKKLA